MRSTLISVISTGNLAALLFARYVNFYNGHGMNVLGVTGTIGSGKSTVCGILEQLGCPVIDADREAHLTYKRGTRTWKRLIATFGDEILDMNGEIDREKLGGIVFADCRARERLNSIVHPATRRRVLKQLARLRDDGHSWAVVEATLLIEAGWQDLTDRLWVVAAPEEAVVARLGRDRGQKEQEIRRRLAAQMPAREKMERADEIIYNDGNLESLQERVQSLWHNLSTTTLPGR